MRTRDPGEHIDATETMVAGVDLRRFWNLLRLSGRQSIEEILSSAFTALPGRTPFGLMFLKGRRILTAPAAIRRQVPAAVQFNPAVGGTLA
jgi:hypothetical protein